jgi:hypothetical protein
MPRDLFVRREPDARFALHVPNQPLQQRRARSMAHDVRVHGEDVEAALVVRDVELRLEHLEHRRRGRIRAVGVAAEVRKVVENPLDRQLHDA